MGVWTRVLSDATSTAGRLLVLLIYSVVVLKRATYHRDLRTSRFRAMLSSRSACHP